MNDAPRRIEIRALQGIPRINAHDPLIELLCDAAENAALEDGDVLTVTSKLFSRAQNRFVLLSDVTPSDEALALAKKVQKEPELVELILRESTAVSRAIPGVLIVRQKLGLVCANAGIDRSNAMPTDAPAHTQGQWALLLPENPDHDAQTLRDAIQERTGKSVGIVITDSHGRPFRHGSIGIAIGAAGFQTLDPHTGRTDLDGRVLEVTETAVADQIAAASDLLAGQADEGTPVILFRGLRLGGEGKAQDLVRDPQRDLYA